MRPLNLVFIRGIIIIASESHGIFLCDFFFGGLLTEAINMTHVDFIYHFRRKLVARNLSSTIISGGYFFDRQGVPLLAGGA